MLMYIQMAQIRESLKAIVEQHLGINNGGGLLSPSSNQMTAADEMKNVIVALTVQVCRNVHGCGVS